MMLQSGNTNVADNFSEESVADVTWHHLTSCYVPNNSLMYLLIITKLELLLMDIILWLKNYSILVAISMIMQVQWCNDTHFNGTIDDIRIYNRALDSTEINSLYHENGYADLTDIDGNEYNTVQIGTQTWMTDNLKTTTYNDGTPIPNVTDGASWGTLITPAYSWYNNDINNKDPYGALYNWYAVETENLCPSGWHVPGDEEWKELEIFLGMTPEQADGVEWRGMDQGTQLKNSSGWNGGIADQGTNIVGFNALPRGYRNYDGNFNNLGLDALWWSSTEYDNTYAWMRDLSINSNGIYRNYYNYNAGDYDKRGGFSYDASKTLILHLQLLMPQ